MTAVGAADYIVYFKNEIDFTQGELEEKIRKLEEKCSEFESSYFDLQMENVQLKSQLEKYGSADE